MANKDKFKITLANSDLSSRKHLTIASFAGVDYNKSQLQVATNHAVDIQNIVFKDRVNQKRAGWEQLTNASAYTYYVLSNGLYVEKTNTTSINGVWEVLDTSNNKRLIAHIGKLLFEIKNLDSDFYKIELEPLVKSVTLNGTTYNVATELEDYKSTAIQGYQRLYIFGGNKFYVLKLSTNDFSLNAVEDDSETYIPTTTIGITEVDSTVVSRAILDDVNLMTEWRKNKCVSGTYIDDGVSLRTTKYTDYPLDTSVAPKTATDINNIVISISSLKEIA